MLNDAHELVTLAQAQVAELEANSPTLEQVTVLVLKPHLVTSLQPSAEFSLDTHICCR